LKQYDTNGRPQRRAVGGTCPPPLAGQNSMFLKYFLKENSMFLDIFKANSMFLPSPGKKSAEAYYGRGDYIK